MIPSRLESLGRTGFGFAIAGFGLAHIAFADFATRLLSPMPDWIPGRSIWALATGGVLLAAGALMAVGKAGGRGAAFTVAALMLLSVLFLRLPLALAEPGAGYLWTNPCKYLALAGGALLIAFSASPRADRLARLLLCLFLTLGGIQHYAYLTFTAKMVPGWMPLRTFFACFAGAALIAGGIGLQIPKIARRAALWAGVMILSWFFLVHIARVAAKPGDGGEWSGLFESLATSGVAFMIAGNGARRPNVE